MSDQLAGATNKGADFLLELRSEEIPARMQDKARADLERLFAAELDKAGIKSGAVVTYATPRRLTLIARDLPESTEPTSIETKGPRVGAPDQAIEGFLRRYGAAHSDLVERNGIYFLERHAAGRMTSRVLGDAIEDIVRAFPWPKSMRWGDASASTESLRWVRPLQGIVAILGDELVPCEIAGIVSGYATVGHRFHSPHELTIGGAHDYLEKLRLAHVIVDQDERRAIVRDRAQALAADAGLTLVEDEGLVAENAGLTEWPVPLLGRFDEAFLDAPPEVIQLTARVNQKYFVCEGADGRLANAFICVANIAAKDGGERIVAGNQKVLAARLSDARFFYDTDLKVPLEEQAKKLEKIVFHEKLGTVADKVERVAKLARWLVEEGIVGAPSVTPAKAGVSGDGSGQEPQATPASAGVTKEVLADQAERAARLAKADLVTGMVGEFPELQGLMGGYYAAAQGEDTAVAEAVRDHYKPVGQGDDVPTAPVTVAVSLADKLDTLAAFFFEDMSPTGSKDPFALRRAALGVLQIIQINKIRVSLSDPFFQVTAYLEGVISGRMDRAALAQLETNAGLAGIRIDGDVWSRFVSALSEKSTSDEAIDEIWDEKVLPSLAKYQSFFADRLKVQQREAGVRHDLIDAVCALGGEDDLVRLLARVHALQSFVATDEGANLLAGYKRAANILKKEGFIEEPQHIPETGEEDPLVEVDDADFAPVVAEFARSERAAALGYQPEPAEDALIRALDEAEPRAASAVEAEDFEGAMAALATLRRAVDAFFDAVTVNDADPAKRQARLALLARMRAAVHRVADFSKIEG